MPSEGRGGGPGAGHGEAAERERRQGARLLAVRAGAGAGALATRSRAWFRECLAEAEGKLKVVCGENGVACIRGVTCADEGDPDWRKLSEPLPDWL
ncbi:MAG: hypothetical protein LBQ12_12850 [Deltaproteobacteria bacterium]|nr:hypothetical protein [Deltaproteobacteria bacterium]